MSGFEDIFPRMAGLKRSFAALCGLLFDTDEVALTTNISIALSTVASCLDLSGERRTILLSELDFPTDGHVWLAWARKTGAEVRFLRSPTALTIPIEEYERAIDERTATRDGQPRPLPLERDRRREDGVRDRPAERGASSFVDDYHGLGIVPPRPPRPRMRPARPGC